MANLLQHRETTQFARLQASSSTSHIATSRPAVLRYGAGQPTAGSEPCQILTLELDHLGDPGHKHDKTVHNLLERHRGKFVKSLGDGILATFDGPGRAIRFSRELRDALSTLGLQIRQGLHTGEIEVSNNDVSGIAVNISARVMDLAGPSQIFSSRTVKDLVAGSGLQFEEIGRRQLKGIPDEWEIFSVM